MRKLFVLIAIGMSLISSAQVSGIQWVENLNWEEIKQRAKVENKYIFLDCFTTWCGPCKKMDKEVYTNEIVGHFFNERFICVKVQMDKTNKDSKQVQAWYEEADKFISQYKIESFPTYIFLAANGETVHRDGGYRLPEDFISLGKIALSPGKQYNDPYAEYNLLKQEYIDGMKKYKKMPYLVKTAISLGDTIARLVAREYFMYLESLNENELYTRDNIEFLASVISSKSKFFKLFYPNGRRCDDTMEKPGYAQNVVDRMIFKEEIRPVIKTSAIGAKLMAPMEDKIDPDWKALFKVIQKKYNKEYAKRNLLEAKIVWYERGERNPVYTKYFVEKVKKYGVDTSDGIKSDLRLNSVAWNIFEKISDRALMNAAADWMSDVVRRSEGGDPVWTAGVLDTYAGLLYKLGRKDEAIDLEKRAVNLSVKAKATEDAFLFSQRVKQMERGEPYWTNIR